MKKLLSLMIALMLSLTAAFAGAGCTVEGIKVKPGHTPLYINVLNCGVGLDFIYNLETKFENICYELNEEDPEKNPKVDIIVTDSDVNGPTALNAVTAGSPTDIFYMNNFPMVGGQFVNASTGLSDALEEITDIVTEGGEDSIWNRMTSNHDYYNVGTAKNPKIYALPWFASYYGTVYDVDLFEEAHLFRDDPLFLCDPSEIEDEKLRLEIENSYLLDYEGLDGIVGNEDDCYGPDGKKDPDGVRIDDGLPATYNDFISLLDQMLAKSITPITFTKKDNYAESWLYSLWSSYEGKQNITTMRDFNGTYTYTTESGTVGTMNIDETNAYEMAFQNGKRAALQVAYDLVHGGYCSQESSGNDDAIAAQKVYLNSIRGASSGNSAKQRMGLLMEGSWWENEAKGYMNNMASLLKNDNLKYGERRFGFMPFPKFTGSSTIPAQVNQKSTLRAGWISASASGVMISKNSDQKDLAKKFLKFAYSEAMCSEFTMHSGVTMPFKYEMTQAQKDNITYFQTNIFNLTQSPYVDTVNGLTRSEYIMRASDVVGNITTFKQGTGTTASNAPFSSFRENGMSLTMDEYWAAVELANTYDWNSMPWMAKYQ